MTRGCHTEQTFSSLQGVLLDSAALENDRNFNSSIHLLYNFMTCLLCKRLNFRLCGGNGDQK